MDFRAIALTNPAQTAWAEIDSSTALLDALYFAEPLRPCTQEDCALKGIRKIALLGGAGMIGQAILEGIVAEGLVPAENIVVTARHHDSLARIRIPEVKQTINNITATRGANVIILCVHPAEYLEVLEEIRPVLKSRQLLISVVTGVSLKALSNGVGGKVAVVRTSPNIAAIVRASMTALCAGPEVNDRQRELAVQIFRSIGEVVQLDERHLNAATGLAGCGPAFAFRIIESLAEGGIKMGLPREISRRMAAQVLRGAGQMVLDTGRHPAYLKDTVLSPGGCTIDGMARLEEGGLPIALIKAVETSTLKAGLLYTDDNE